MLRTFPDSLTQQANSLITTYLFIRCCALVFVAAFILAPFYVHSVLFFWSPIASSLSQNLWVCPHHFCEPHRHFGLTTCAPDRLTSCCPQLTFFFLLPASCISDNWTFWTHHLCPIDILDVLLYTIDLLFSSCQPAVFFRQLNILDTPPVSDRHPRHLSVHNCSFFSLASQLCSADKWAFWIHRLCPIDILDTLYLELCTRSYRSYFLHRHPPKFTI
jgi:hypothetical protein